MVFAVIVGLVATVGWLAWLSRPTPPPPVPAGSPSPLPVGQLRLGQNVLTVEVADTPNAQSRGLSGRAGLANDAGMLFTYAASTTPRFWMPQMRFALDLIWIADGRVVGVTPGVTPDTYPDTFSPPQPVTQVLEVNAGWAASHGVAAGAAVEWPVD